MKSYALVTAQFLLIGLLALPFQTITTSILAWCIALGLLMMAVVLGVWSVISLKRSNLSVMPQPVAAGTLIENGPYRVIRHPMYTAVLLYGLAAVVFYASGVKLLLLALLAITLWQKWAYEESLLINTYSGYQQYKERTHAILPGIL